jgi:hypothetical protein
MEEEELRERVGQLRLDLLVRCNQEVIPVQGPLLYRAAQWAQTEDPERLAYLTEIPLDEVKRMARAFEFRGIWPRDEL